MWLLDLLLPLRGRFRYVSCTKMCFAMCSCTFEINVLSIRILYKGVGSIHKDLVFKTSIPKTWASTRETPKSLPFGTCVSNFETTVSGPLGIQKGSIRHLCPSYFSGVRSLTCFDIGWFSGGLYYFWLKNLIYDKMKSNKTLCRKRPITFLLETTYILDCLIKILFSSLHYHYSVRRRFSVLDIMY